MVAVAGPWFFDRIYVPAQYPCSFRLEGDFCGVPTSGTYLLLGAVSEFLHRTRELLGGVMGLGEWTRSFAIILLPSLLVLPFFITALLILSGEGRNRPLFAVAAWGLAASMGLLIGFSSYLQLFRGLWGIWLYISVAAAAAILEALTLAAERRSSPEQREGRQRT
jgi:hypothetical protein